jgi:hypothetical protein
LLRYAVCLSRKTIYAWPCINWEWTHIWITRRNSYLWVTWYITFFKCYFCGPYSKQMALSWLRWLVSDVPRRPRFTHIATFVVDKMALGQGYLQGLWLPLSVSFLRGCPCVSPEGWTIGPLVAAIQRHRIAPRFVHVGFVVDKVPLRMCRSLISKCYRLTPVIVNNVVHPLP